MARPISPIVKKAMRAYSNGATNIYRLAKRFCITPSTIYRAIKKRDQDSARQRRYYRANPVKARCRILFKTAVEYGKLTRQPCEVCGEKKSEGHHDDYSKPLDVRWLCRKHHVQVHFPNGAKR